MQVVDAYPLLSTIESPADLRRLPQAELEKLATELRSYLIEAVSQKGGHFAAGLGVVELSVALHYIYQTPHDRVVWDVGHQAYPHKVLTGRRERLSTIKHKGGLAPFPARHESPYDAFGAGHSSTSLSAALGMAIAAARTATARRVVAVIGDGAMSAGMAFEALNHIGSLDIDMLVVLNDNDMSISEAIGAFSNYLAGLLSSKRYEDLRSHGKRLLRRVPPALALARSSQAFVRGIMRPETIFDDMGLHYVGPIDGHDLGALITTLRNLRERRGPHLLHVVTTKGKGYPPAEADPIAWHGPGPFDPRTGVVYKEKSSGPSYSQVFGQWLIDAASADERVVAITPAMREGSGLVEYSRRFPERYFDVGIAEQHAVTVAAGMACDGLKPVVAIYSTFLQRAYDQLIHDVALQNLPVVFAIDRAGMVGGDGATHQGSFDLSYQRCVPNLTIMAPADENECRQMLHTALVCGRPAAVRYPRGTGPGVTIQSQMSALPIGKAELKRAGQGVAILAFGSMVSACQALADEHDMTLVNMRFIKPLDERTVLDMAAQHDALVTVEENVVAGGGGSAINEVLLAADVHMPVLNVGIPDRFIEHGSREDCLVSAGLDRASLEPRILQWWQAHAPVGWARIRAGARLGALAAFRARRARLSQ
ncbi:MAG TPA: 1-deoxy-D-xylulose-5-phosphate synthase [Steroidobacteraceae bacterium]|jgi:1-deoxy-D-xylulose-5-phosphate synthase|nr:1-deoxy-D-xylulose-5-phosphate synthase [Steroidobacteraceae bacterium]